MTAPEQLDALVVELREVAERAYADDDAYVFGITPEEATAAADAITALRAEIARLTAERDAALAAERAATIEAAAKACELMAYRQRSDAARFRAGTDPSHFRLALAEVADEIALSVRSLHTEATRATLEPQPDTERAEPVARPAGCIGFDANTGEYTAEWCSVQPFDATGFVPLYAAPQPAQTPQAQPITVQDAARALLDKRGAALNRLVEMIDDVYAGGASMGFAVGSALRAIANKETK